MTRQEFSERHPLHVTLRILDAVGRLRVRKVLRAIAEAMRVVAGRDDFRIVHASIQENHLHLVCEATSKAALTRGIQGFKISAARRINRYLGRRGAVFADRYHVEVIRTPTQMRAALCYVLNNWRKHRVDRGCASRVDPFATGMHFRGWKERDIPSELVLPPGVEILPHTPPRTWLLQIGWSRCRPISLFEIPGPRAS